MATKSILKNIIIKNKKTCYSLINALENAQDKTAKKVNFSKGYYNASKEDIDKIFK